MFMLKKLSFIVTMILINDIAINAQFKKGDKIAGVSIASAFYNNGSTALSTSISSTTTTNNNFGISVNPSIGWFINENIAIGIMPTIGYKKQKLIGKTSTSNTFLKDKTNQFNMGIGGFARYYFNGKSNTTRFFGQYDLSLGLSGSKTEGFQYETLGVYVDRYNQKSSGDFFANNGLTLGVSRFFADHVSLDFYIGYKFSYTKSNPKGTSLRDFSDPNIADQTQMINYDQKFTGHNVVAGVGFQLFIPKKK
jgi:hypothetical protein